MPAFRYQQSNHSLSGPQQQVLSVVQYPLTVVKYICLLLYEQIISVPTILPQPQYKRYFSW